MRSCAASPADYCVEERAGHTLQPTALVHEAYLRLVGVNEMRIENRRHFYGAAATAMRRILVDHARTRRADKRGGPDAQRVPFDDAIDTPIDVRVDFERLDEALEALAGERLERFVEALEIDAHVDWRSQWRIEQGNLQRPAPWLIRSARARMVDEDPPHHRVGRRAVEVAPVLNTHLVGTPSQAQVRLVHERGRRRVAGRS